MQLRNARLHNHLGSTDCLPLGVTLLSHRDHAVAVHIQANVLIMRPLPITPQLVMGWPVGCQHTHTAHFIVGRNEPAGSGHQPFYVVLACGPRCHLHNAHDVQLLRAARSVG
jgi:hypothetical protein